MSTFAGSTVSRHGLGAIGAFAFLALWELAARWVWRDVQVLPAPTQAIELHGTTSRRASWQAMWASA